MSRVRYATLVFPAAHHSIMFIDQYPSLPSQPPPHLQRRASWAHPCWHRPPCPSLRNRCTSRPCPHRSDTEQTLVTGAGGGLVADWKIGSPQHAVRHVAWGMACEAQAAHGYFPLFPSPDAAAVGAREVGCVATRGVRAVAFFSQQRKPSSVALGAVVGGRGSRTLLRRTRCASAPGANRFVWAHAGIGVLYAEVVAAWSQRR